VGGFIGLIIKKYFSVVGDISLIKKIYDNLIINAQQLNQIWYFKGRSESSPLVEE